jgi:hypothetical protein
MRVNVYAEEMTDRVELIEKGPWLGVRFYLELPVTNINTGDQMRGPFVHGPGDDDSSAVTFWGKQSFREVLQKALTLLDQYYEERESNP